MHIEEYLHERLLPHMIREACQRHDITYESFSDEWILRLSRGNTSRWICGYRFDLNPSAAGAVAQDKVAAYLALSAQNIPAIPHYLVRSMPGEMIDRTRLDSVLQPNAAVVSKPLIGNGGHDVRVQPNAAAAYDYIAAQAEPAWTISPHYEIRVETRYLMLDGDVLLAYEKYDPTVKNGLKLFNLSHGAKARTLTPEQLDGTAVQLAIQSCSTLGLRLAAVDIVTTADNEQYVLEVNDSISFEHYARQSNDHRDNARAVYEAIVTAMV